MPKKPRKQRYVMERLTPGQLMHLLHGWCLDNQFHPYYRENGDLQFPFKDDTHRRELYFEYKEYLFSLAGKQVDGVFAQLPEGKKPKAFYDYEGKRCRENHASHGL